MNGVRLYQVMRYVLLVVFGLFFVLPLLWMAVTAFKPSAEWLDSNWIPHAPTWDNFTSIFDDPTLPVRRWFFNSFVIATVFTLLILILDSMAAYAYARMEFRGRKMLFGLLLATLVMPQIMFLIPNYITIANLGWLGTYQGVMAPGLSGVFGVFFLRQFFLSLPRELEEAAILEGANSWQIFTKVILPLSKPALATLAVISFLTNWNDFIWPVYTLFSPENFTLPPGLGTLQGAYNINYPVIMAGAALASIPALILFMVSQRYIIEGVSRSGLKG